MPGYLCGSYILGVVTHVGAATPCVKNISIVLLGFFTLPFTPYGYKFEKRASWNNELIYEKYSNVEMEQPQRKPWMLDMSGFIHVSGGNVGGTGSDGWHWSSTSYKDASTVYRLGFNIRDLYSSITDSRWRGVSVRKEQLKPAHGVTILAVACI